MTYRIFKTIHGSHLYGMATENSDLDTFEVTTSERTRARQSVNDGVDTVRVGWDTFLSRVFEGSHQSVEALFSPYKEWGESEYGVMLRTYIAGMRITGPTVFAKYERTIKSFCYGDFKRRRHAVRLSFNLTGLRYEGRFNPVMTPFQIARANELANNLEDENLWKELTSQTT